MKLMLLISVLTITATRSYAQDALQDLTKHASNLTFVAVGRPAIVHPKVGDGPCFSKLYTGNKAFGTINDSWFGVPPSASDQPITLQELTALITDLNKQGVFSNAQSRVVRQSEIQRSEPDCPHTPKCRRSQYEGTKSNLVCAAIALGYQQDDLIHYYLLAIANRQVAIHIFEHAQTLLENNADAQCSLGNIIWRLKQGESQPANAPYSSPAPQVQKR